MTKPMFEGLCVGDAVFVVPLLPKIFPQKRGPRSFAGLQRVVKMGRKYGYIQGDSEPTPFRLDNGESPDGNNTRSNGYGFDVYPSEAAYLECKEERAQKARLKKRLEDGWRGIDLEGIRHHAVMNIHAILDAEGIDKKETT